MKKKKRTREEGKPNSIFFEGVVENIFWVTVFPRGLAVFFRKPRHHAEQSRLPGQTPTLFLLGEGKR